MIKSPGIKRENFEKNFDRGINPLVTELSLEFNWFKMNSDKSLG